MEKKYLLAIDAGTGSVRAVIFDTEGTQLGVVQSEWEHPQDPRFPGSMNFDWVRDWELASSCVRGVIEKTGADPAQIAAVSTTCMREGILLYDSDGNEIWACANVDSRSTDEVAALVKKDPGLEKEIYLESGEAYALGALPRLMWVKNKMPEVYGKTARLGMFNDWLIYKLTGDEHVEPSNGSTTGIFDLKKRVWDPAITDKVGIRSDIFPTVRECGTLAGTVNEKGARDTGLAVGTPVIVGGGDSQLGCIGVGVTKPGQAAIFGGSFWQYEFNTATGETDPGCRIRVNCHAVPGVWQFEALAFNPGLVLRWYRDAFCQREREIAEKTGEDVYELMNKEAERIPAGSNGMMCAFSDVMNFTCWKHASPTFTNFSIDPAVHNRYTFYRAILENAALVTRGHVELVREVTGNMPGEVVFAGGASKSALWCQILADVLKLPVRVPAVREATALGAAMLAGVGAGIYSGIDEAAERCVKWDAVYEPDPANSAVYDEMYPAWREVYKAQLALADRGLTKNMWKAPGV